MAANNLPPIPQTPISESQSWRDWFRNLGTYVQLAQSGGQVWSIIQGGTGSNTAAGARTNLGLGDLAVQNAANVNITGGSIHGVNLTGKVPFGAFHDTTTQTAAAATIAAVTFNTTDYSSGVSVGTPTSHLVIAKAGVYLVSFSAQQAQAGLTQDNVTFWFRVNGADSVASSGITATPPKVGTINGAITAGWGEYFTFAAGDYIQLMWTTDNGASALTTYPVGTTPVRPLVPSVAININFLSET